MQEVSDRLTSGRYGWLTTVAKSGQPVPRLVWFFLDGSSLIVYTMPSAAKVRHVGTHPVVSINLDSDGQGGGIIAIGGTATIDAEGVDCREHGPCWAKYGEGPREVWPRRLHGRLQHPVAHQHRQGLDHADRELIATSTLGSRRRRTA